MKRIKMLLMSVVAALAIGAVGASAASAAPGEGNIQIDAGSLGPAACDFVFTNGSWYTDAPGWSVDVGNVGADPNGVCTVDNVSGTLTFQKFSDGSVIVKDGALTVDTTVTIPIIGDIPVSCDYSDFSGLGGTWSYVDEEEGIKAVEMAGEVPTDSGWPCPGVEVTSLTAEIDG